MGVPKDEKALYLVFTLRHWDVRLRVTGNDWVSYGMIFHDTQDWNLKKK